MQRHTAIAALVSVSGFLLASATWAQQPAPQDPPPYQPPPYQPAPQQPAPQQPAPWTYAPPGTQTPPTGPSAPPGSYAPGPSWNPYANPPQGPPPPPLPPREPGCCRFAVRFDPFDLIFRRLSFQVEVALWGPLSIEAEPSWIWGSTSDNLEMSGGALFGNLLVYFTGHALNGFYIKAQMGFEAFTATVTDPELQQTASKDIASPVFGASIGSSNVFGDEWGFNIAGGVGIGYATADRVTVTAGRYSATFYDKLGSLQLLASLGAGVAF
ncbi:MAG: hypothetical protein U0271_20690 [Polyangiaceae bacterium]